MLAGIVQVAVAARADRNPDGAERRAQVVLGAMAEPASSPTRRAAKAIAQPAHALKQTSAGSINYVADWVMDVLDDLVGRVEDDIVVETTIDPAMQAARRAGAGRGTSAKGGKFGVEQGAVVAMTPDGAVRALVGGRNYAESQFNRAVAAKRQPGSAFKPFVYLTALERGLTPEPCARTGRSSIKGWKPENYTPRILRPGDADPGAGDVAQHGVGAARRWNSARLR